MQTEVMDIPAGKIAAIVTHLEMVQPPRATPLAAPNGLALRQISCPAIAWYKALYRQIGENWLWFSRLAMSDDALEAVLTDPLVEVYALSRGDQDLGLMELDFRQPESCELVFLGITDELIGTGAGRYLMAAATARAWSQDIARFHVHTCSLDHPGAMGFYQKAGFAARRQQVEIADDPRLLGLLPETAAPQVPLLRTA
ncbi:N-acetyltransferase [Pseudoruegeria sp. SK021]|uniref:GNAT family N-acetyltransferase n=1 Tax=Pseudoruegeria sp. SK021 TaxID=1933035 RepID=UPI000A240E65|nr:GNAT family N-acetyltransferase [Pseudoruegeria sp. SK021]OSP55647.1 GNAT family N-acetyltransferase [Pseudoruegeria sp. SK021]